MSRPNWPPSPRNSLARVPRRRRPRRPRRFVITTNTAMPKLAAVIAATPIDTIKAWMAFRVADQAAPYLSKPYLEHLLRAPREKKLSGQGTSQAALEAWASRGRRQRLRRRIELPRNDELGPRPTLHRQTFPAGNQGGEERPDRQPDQGAPHPRSRSSTGCRPATKTEAIKKLDTYHDQGRLSR